MSEQGRKRLDMENIKDLARDVKETILDPEPDYKHMTDIEQTKLLRKMIVRQEKDIKLQRIMAFAECGLLVVLILIFAILVPRFFKTVKSVDETMQEVDGLIEHAESSLEIITDLVLDADKVIERNEGQVADAIGHFNSVDFDSLNRSIASLADILQPILEMLEVFK